MLLFQEYKAAFKLLDKNGDGTIDTKELSAAMKAFGIDPTEADIKVFFLNNKCSILLKKIFKKLLI